MSQEKINLMKVDRFAHLAGGIALLGWGMTRARKLSGKGAAGLGGWLLYQAYTGFNPMFTPLGIRVNRYPSESGATETVVVDECVTINAPREKVYAFWNDIEGWKRIAPRVQHIQASDARFSRWVVAGPGGVPLEWQSEILNEIPGREIAWRATHEGRLAHFGTVELFDVADGEATVVQVRLEYVSPRGTFGVALARMTGQSVQCLVVDALRNLKRLIEAGKIATATVGQSAGGDPQDPGAENVAGEQEPQSA